MVSLVIEIWVLTIAITSIADYGGIHGKTEFLDVKLPTEKQCENVKKYMEDLNMIVSEFIRTGDCRKVLKNEDSIY